MGILTNDDILFLEQNIDLYNSIIRAGYCRNYTRVQFNRLNEIYLNNVGKERFTHWCDDCRLSLVKYVYHWYLNSKSDKIEEVKPEVIEKKKRGRKPKINKDANN